MLEMELQYTSHGMGTSATYTADALKVGRIKTYTLNMLERYKKLDV